MESYGNGWNMVEDAMSLYVILGWIMHHSREVWTIVEHSGVFWVMVQREKKW